MVPVRSGGDVPSPTEWRGSHLEKNITAGILKMGNGQSKTLYGSKLLLSRDLCVNERATHELSIEGTLAGGCIYPPDHFSVRLHGTESPIVIQHLFPPIGEIGLCLYLDMFLRLS